MTFSLDVTLKARYHRFLTYLFWSCFNSVSNNILDTSVCCNRRRVSLFLNRDIYLKRIGLLTLPQQQEDFRRRYSTRCKADCIIHWKEVWQLGTRVCGPVFMFLHGQCLMKCWFDTVTQQWHQFYIYRNVNTSGLCCVGGRFESQQGNCPNLSFPSFFSHLPP